MGFLKRIGNEFKGIVQEVGSVQRFPGYGYTAHYGSNPLLWMLRDGDGPFEGVEASREVHYNSVVNICLRYISRHFSLAEPLIQRENGGKWDAVTEHPFYNLLRIPNNHYDGAVLMAATAASLAMGNGYWLISRDVAGNPRELWWAPQLYESNGVFGCTPYSESGVNDGLPFCYLYRVNGFNHYLPIEDVIHFRLPLPDPVNPFIGENPMDAQKWQVGADNQVSQYTFHIAKNCGVVGALFINQDTNKTVDEAAAEKLKRKWRDATTGRGRGDASVLPHNFDVKFPETSPDKMAIEVLGDSAEERIPAAFGLNAIALNLGAGLAHSTYENGKQAHSAAYDGGIAPLHKIVAQTITNKLLPQLVRGRSTGAKFRLHFDDSKVPSQQEDENAKHDRLRADWEKNLMTIGEWYAETGKPMPEGVEPTLRFVDFQPKSALPEMETLPQLEQGKQTKEVKADITMPQAFEPWSDERMEAESRAGQDDLLDAMEGRTGEMRELLQAQPEE